MIGTWVELLVIALPLSVLPRVTKPKNDMLILERDSTVAAPGVQFGFNDTGDICLNESVSRRNVRGVKIAHKSRKDFQLDRFLRSLRHDEPLAEGDKS